MNFVFNKLGYTIIWTLVMAIFGPLLGALQFVIYMSFYGGLSTFNVLPFAFIYSMAFFVPALVTGLIVSLFKKQAFRVWHIFAFSLIGSVLAYLWLIYISKSIDNEKFELMVILVAFTSTLLITSLLYLHSKSKIPMNQH